MSDRWQKMRALVRQPPNTIIVVNADSVGAILAERDQLLAALTELVAAYKQVAEGSGDDGADLARYDRAMDAAERLIAGDKTE